MEKVVKAIKEITKHGEVQPKSLKYKDDDYKVKVKFQKSDKRSKALEKAKKMHSTPH